MPEVFYTPRVKGPQRNKMLDDVVARHPETFATRDIAAAYMSRIIMPHSANWAYCGNGKSGTSSTKSFLFELEFGYPLTVSLALTSDINPDVASQQLPAADVFRQLSAFKNGLRRLRDTLRLATVRHPASRALSAFRYLCLSHDQAHPYFAGDRLRMNALVGFDWQRDPSSARGFEKFLRYIEVTIEAAGTDAVNPHWRPQIANIKPDIFRPHLVGRTENLEQFFRAVADNLNTPLASDWQSPAANTQSNRQNTETLYSDRASSLINTIYRADFDAFDYSTDRSVTPSPLAPPFAHDRHLQET